MTPEQYRTKKIETEKEIESLKYDLAFALNEALGARFPDKVRAAKPEDIVEGTLVWFGDEVIPINGNKWGIVTSGGYDKGCFWVITANCSVLYQRLKHIYIDITTPPKQP